MSGLAGLRRLLRVVVLALLTLLLVPAAGVRPAVIGLYSVETATAVDFSDGIVWFLVLGSDDEGNTDVIQLVGVDARTSAAVALGIPRDSWLDMPVIGRDRINAAYRDGGPDVAAQAVEQVTGIAPDYVLEVGMEGFLELMDTVGPVEVSTPEAFRNAGVTVREGRNRFRPEEALAYVRFRRTLDGGDFDRSANHQRLMRSALGRLRAQADAEGFMERATLTALDFVETDLAPTEVYRLAQFLTTVDPRTVDSCVLRARPGAVGEISVVFLDRDAALRVGEDAEKDARLQRGCPSPYSG